jgi:hypothetical protein
LHASTHCAALFFTRMANPSYTSQVSCEPSFVEEHS